MWGIPDFVRERIKSLGYVCPYGAMQGHIDAWRAMLDADGKFWDYYSKNDGIVYKVHRRSVKPAQRVSEEWASLIMNDDTTVQTDSEQCTEWLADWMAGNGFLAKGQLNVADAFALGTAAWALCPDTEKGIVKARRFSANMIIPLSWDDDDITECAFCSKTVIKGREYTQLQVHTCEKTYRIRLYLWGAKDEPVNPESVGMLDELETGSTWPTFAVIKPAIKNRFVEFSPYGQAIFASHEDVLKSVDLTYDALMNEVDIAKARVFLSDLLFEHSEDENGKRLIPFGKEDLTTFRMVQASSDFIKEYAPTMRTDSQVQAYRTALQTLGDRCGFGSSYFDINKSGGIRTAEEVSSGNSELMRNIKRHENGIGAALASMFHALLAIERNKMGVALEDEGVIRVSFDDSIITDTMSEKQQDLSEVNLTMNPWEFRAKWYGEDEDTAKANVPGLSYDDGALE